MKILKRLSRVKHKISDYDNLEKFSNKNYKDLQEYKNEYQKLSIQSSSYKAMYEQELKHRRLLEEKILTMNNNEYDSIGLPKLDIKNAKNKLRLCDAMTLATISEIIKLDYYDMVSILSNSLEDSNKYELSIACSTLRRRYQVILDILGGYTKESSYVDRGTGEIKPVTKK